MHLVVLMKGHVERVGPPPHLQVPPARGEQHLAPAQDVAVPPVGAATAAACNAQAQRERSAKIKLKIKKNRF